MAACRHDRIHYRWHWRDHQQEKAVTVVVVAAAVIVVAVERIIWNGQW